MDKRLMRSCLDASGDLLLFLLLLLLFKGKQSPLEVLERETKSAMMLKKVRYRTPSYRYGIDQSYQRLKVEFAIFPFGLLASQWGVN